MKLDHVTDQDRHELLESFRQVENIIDETLEDMKPTMTTEYFIIPFVSQIGYGYAHYSKSVDRVVKVTGSKIINGYSMFTNKPKYPKYERIEVEV